MIDDAVPQGCTEEFFRWFADRIEHVWAARSEALAPAGFWSDRWTSEEIAECERVFDVTFPGPYRCMLRTLRGSRTDVSFYDARRDRQQIVQRIENVRGESLGRLWPLLGHRYLRLDPILDTHPVLSVYMGTTPTDTIVYGANLRDWLLLEYERDLGLDPDFVRETWARTNPVTAALGL